MFITCSQALNKILKKKKIIKIYFWKPYSGCLNEEKWKFFNFKKYLGKTGKAYMFGTFFLTHQHTKNF